MEIEPDAQRRIDEHIRASVQAVAAEHAGETSRELGSHLFEAAAQKALDAGATRIQRAHVEAALRDMGAPEAVAKDLAIAHPRWRPRIRLDRRGIASIGLAGTAAFIGCAYILVGALCRFSRTGGTEAYETCGTGVTAWAGLFLAAALAGVVGVWLAVRWIPFVAAAFLLILPLFSIGGDWFFGLLCAALFVAAGSTMPGTGRRAPRTGPSWHYLLFVPLGLVGAVFVQTVIAGWLDVDLEGPKFLVALSLNAFVFWVLLVVLLRRRLEASFAAGSGSIMVLTTFLGFLLLWVASFSGSGCFVRGPAEANWSEPGRFVELPPPGRHGNLTLTQVAPAPGLPFRNATYDQRYGASNYSLERLQWRAPVQEHWGESWFILDAGATVGFGWTSAHTDATIQDLARTFLQNITTADAAAIEKAARDLVANRTNRGQVFTGDPDRGAPATQVYHASMRLDLPLRLEALWQEQGGQREDPIRGAPLNPEWSWGFSFARAEAAGTIDQERVRFTLDAQGVATLQVGDHDGATVEQSQRILQAVYSDLGLGVAPTTVTPEATQQICVD